MGNRNHRTLFYVSTGIAALLLLLFWGVPKTVSHGKWSPLKALAEEEMRVSVSTYEGSSRKSKHLKGSAGQDEPYQASKNYVNSYTPSTSYQHPLVASTKFISKKDQKKKKLKQRKLLAKDKKDASRSTRQFGFSDDGEDSITSLPMTTTQFARQQNKAQNQTAQNENAQEKEEQENLNSFEYWEKPIFIDENGEMVSKLVESFQGQKVSNGVFYELVTEMRQDERIQVREFGLTALTATPSVQSFAQLSTMKHTDPEAALRTAAGQEVANYYREQRLSHVVNALKLNVTAENRATYEALVVLYDATKKYSVLGEVNPTPTRSNSSSVEPKFEQALTVIEQTRLTESPDVKIKTQAERTSHELTEFLSRPI